MKGMLCCLVPQARGCRRRSAVLEEPCLIQVPLLPPLGSSAWWPIRLLSHSLRSVSLVCPVSWDSQWLEAHISLELFQPRRVEWSRRIQGRVQQSQWGWWVSLGLGNSSTGSLSMWPGARSPQPGGSHVRLPPATCLWLHSRGQAPRTERLPHVLVLLSCRVQAPGHGRGRIEEARPEPVIWPWGPPMRLARPAFTV